MNQIELDPTAYDPMAPDFMQSPYGFYQALRHCPSVFYDERYDMYFVSRYESAQEMLRNPSLFSSDIDRRDLQAERLPSEILRRRAQLLPRTVTITQNDDEMSHGAYRKLVSGFFLPKALAGTVEPFIIERVGQLLDGIDSQGEVDFVSAFAVPLPVSVIGKLIGLDDHGWEELKAWSDAFADEIGLVADSTQALQAIALVERAQTALLSYIASRRASPKNDILSHLAAARLANGRQLADAELFSILSQLLVAGNETTTNSLSAAVLRLASDPVFQRSLRADPNRMGTFIDELLRLDAPVQGQFRRATDDTELEGTPIPKGALLHIRLASANRDPSVYGDTADTLTLDAPRRPPHLSFGSGMHFCLGAVLAKIELQQALTAMLRGYRDISLAVLPTELHWRHHFSHRGIVSLPIIFSR